MRVLVTGGAGFIASHIVDALIREGHDVSVVDNLYAGKIEDVNPKARLYQISITDSKALGEVFAKERPEIVNHHAAQTNVRHSMAEPSFDAQVNIVGSINALQNAATHGVSRFIFASTCAVYAEPERIPMDEQHPILPQSGYGMSKHTVENYIRLYSDVYGLRYKIFRYGNVYGPRQNLKGEAGVVAIFTEQFLGGVQPTIFGDGGKTRDYVFVEDVVAANLLAMEDPGDNDVFNLGRGIEVSDFEIFDAVRRAAGSSTEPAYAPKRPGEAERVSLDSSKAKKALGWSPTVEIDHGVQQVVRYYLRNHAGS